MVRSKDRSLSESDFHYSPIINDCFECETKIYNFKENFFFAVPVL